MSYERMDEPIEMIVHFASKKVIPLRFLWRNLPHKVQTVRGRWVTLEGRQKCYHWAIVADGVGSCEISLDIEQMLWQINTVSTES